MDVSKRPLVIIGFKSSGKSTIGRLLARALGRNFLDLDDVLVDRYEDEQGEWLTFREIFEREGAERFRQLELAAARDVLGREELLRGGLVLALGGGTLMHEPTRDLLANVGTTIYLRVPFGAIIQRIRRRGWPAYVQDAADPAAALERLMEEREPVYLELADVVMELPARISRKETLEQVLAAVREVEDPKRPAASAEQAGKEE